MRFMCSPIPFEESFLLHLFSPLFLRHTQVMLQTTCMPDKQQRQEESQTETLFMRIEDEGFHFHYCLRVSSSCSLIEFCARRVYGNVFANQRLFPLLFQTEKAKKTSFNRIQETAILENLSRFIAIFWFLSLHFTALHGNVLLLFSFLSLHFSPDSLACSSHHHHWERERSIVIIIVFSELHSVCVSFHMRYHTVCCLERRKMI